jgi:hypothetical protein
MGILKSGALVIIGGIFLITGLLMSTILVFQNSVSYENLDSGLSTYLDSLLKETNFEKSIEENLPIMQLYCQNNSEYSFFDKNTNEVFVLDCGIINNGAEEIKNKIMEDLLESIYYEEYDCNFFDCFKKTESGFFLFSKKAYDYWGNLFYKFLFLILISFGIIFFLVEKKSNAFVLSGILLVLSVIPLLFFNKILIKIPYIKEFIFLFSSSSSVFWKFILIGGLICLVGFLIKFFSVGFKISNFFQKFQKNKNPPKIKK